jgi:hypothetical protein
LISVRATRLRPRSARERRRLAAAVAGQLHVGSEQRLEPSEIALLYGCEEPPCQVVALLARRPEAGPALVDVLSSAGGELAHVVLALADDPCNRQIPVVEHVGATARRAARARGSTAAPAVVASAARSAAR